MLKYNSNENGFGVFSCIAKVVFFGQEWGDERNRVICSSKSLGSFCLQERGFSSKISKYGRARKTKQYDYPSARGGYYGSC